MDDNGRQILRPVPRRPFKSNSSVTTAPAGDHADCNDAASVLSSQMGIDLSSPRFLNADFDRNESASSLTRPQSLMNLTSSTLMGIYSEAASGSRDYLVNDDEEPDTPWGTGARTPIRRPGIDEATYELMCDRSHPPSQKTSLGPSHRGGDLVSPSPVGNISSIILRASLLCVLGLGYGVLVTRLHKEQNHLPPLLHDNVLKPGNNWGYLTFWGLGGVVLGSLLPWFDTVWANMFDDGSDRAMADKDKDAGPGTDWALVMRAVGAFVGIIFAIRKLAWVSTLQLSATLALVNPLLWWLIDRSKSGFVLSSAVGLTGSAVLFGVKPDIMPVPLVSPVQNNSIGFESEPFVLSRLASQQTVETVMYMLSVLFCSCICFGNIGRRLTWNKSRGRWGGVR